MAEDLAPRHTTQHAAIMYVLHQHSRRSGLTDNRERCRCGWTGLPGSSVPTPVDELSYDEHLASQIELLFTDPPSMLKPCRTVRDDESKTFYCFEHHNVFDMYASCPDDPA